MNGFIAFLPVASTLNKLKITAHKLKPIRNNSNKTGGVVAASSTGSSSHSPAVDKVKAQVKVFSPREQVIEQAKDNLKRNREEAVVPAPDGINILEVKKAGKTAAAPKKKTSSKIHKQYAKKKKSK